MMARESTAWAPAHLTGFFEIHDKDPDPLRCGSRGAGICIEEGVKSTVRFTAGPETKIEVRFDGAPAEARTTVHAVRLLLGETTGVVEIDSKFKLPVGQGLGMSGAGALSTTLALAPLLGLGREAAVEAAHIAEVKERTGLGDVGGAAMGGASVITQPGCPPYGHFVRIPWQGPVALVVLGPVLETRSVLADPKVRAKISAAASSGVDRLKGNPTPELFYDIAKRFAEETGLATDAIRAAIRDVERSGGKAAMTMLGHTVFATGALEATVPILRKHGTVIKSKLSASAARLLDGSEEE